MKMISSKSPKEVIDEIRKKRFGIGLDLSNVSGDIRDYINQNEEFKDKVARLIKDLYSRKPHFVLELIQNAEDNDYDENVTPTIKFIICVDKIVIQNNEKGFKEKDVWSLCGIGETTKQKKLGYIGEKGIGFKSVFMVTNEPQIYSNGFQFKFSYDKDRPISIIIPEWVEEVPPFVVSGVTNIVLPLKEDVKKEEINKIIEEINPLLLLFLRKLKRIEIEIKDEEIGDKVRSKHWYVEKYDDAGRVRLRSPEEESSWKIVRKELEVPPNIKEEKREGIEKTEIILAFPLKSDGSVETSKEQKVFVYLPVRSYGFKFIIQADFLTPPSREDVYKDREWNVWLRDSIASVFLEAVEEFKNDEKLKRTYYNYIPVSEEIRDEFFKPVVKQIQSALRERQCILAASGNWLKPSEVLRADEEVRELIPNEDLKKILGKEYVSPEIQAKADVLEALGVKKLELDDLVKFLRNNEEWLKKQSDEWFVKLYTYLKKKLKDGKQKQVEEIKGLKIIRLENDELTSIKEGTIFFSLDKKGNYIFEGELRVVKRTICEPKEEKKEIIEFLKEIGVQEASPYEIIEEHILKVYKDGTWEEKDPSILKSYIRYIRDNIETYKSVVKSQQKKEDPLESLKKTIRIRKDKRIDKDEDDYDNPENLYLPKAYGNEIDLEILFEGINGVYFVHKEYIDDIETDDEEERRDEIERWREFFIELGVNTGLRVIPKPGELLKETFIDYELKHLEEILRIINERRDRRRAKLLLDLLERDWKTLSKFKQCIYESYHRNRLEHCSYHDSSWLWKLKNTDWIPTSDGRLAKPSEVFLNKQEIRMLLGDTVSYIAIDINIKNEELIKSLGINVEPNLDGIIKNLISLKERNYQDKNLFAKLYDFLDKHYYSNEEFIKNSFSKYKIIYIPDTKQKYFSSGEVIWKNVSKIFGENRGYLEEHYPNLKSFFVNKLGIREEPEAEDYANVLLDLSKKKTIEKNDEDIIFKIYKKLNDVKEIYKEKWWNDFIKKPIFWTHRNKFRENDGNIFVNDDPDLYELFKNDRRIAFLKLPENYYLKLENFIKATGIKYLSKAVKIKLREKAIKRVKIAEEKTRQIRSLIPYILRYIYYQEHDTYEKLKEDGTFLWLKDFHVYSVDVLEVEYILNAHEPIISSPVQRNAVLYNGNLYVQEKYINTDEELLPLLSSEISKLFGDIKGLDHFILSLLLFSNSDRIENYLKNKKIKELPEEEKEWFEKNFSEISSKIVERREIREIEVDVRPMEVQIQEGMREEPKIKPFKDVSHEDVEYRSEVLKRDKRWAPEVEPYEVEPSVIQFEGAIIQFEEIDESKSPTKYIDGENSRTFQALSKETRGGPLSKEEKEEIGRWGERLVFEYLKRKYPEKHIEVYWLNENCESGKPYDILVVEGEDKKYIEVKSTTTDNREWFIVTENEWEFMLEKGEKFHIYRVYNAGTKRAKIEIIPNPKKLFEEGKLRAHPVHIYL